MKNIKKMEVFREKIPFKTEKSNITKTVIIPFIDYEITQTEEGYKNEEGKEISFDKDQMGYYIIRRDAECYLPNFDWLTKYSVIYGKEIKKHGGIEHVRKKISEKPLIIKYIATFKDGTLIPDTIPREAVKAYLEFSYLEESAKL